jgi:hypothetical protein
MQSEVVLADDLPQPRLDEVAEALIHRLAQRLEDVNGVCQVGADESVRC